MEKVINSIVGTPEWFRETYGTTEKLVMAVFQARTAKDKNPTCPGCGSHKSNFHPVRKRRAMQCSKCGFQLNPLAGTVWARIKFNLGVFAEMAWDIATSKHLISAKHLRDRFRVNYKTAYMASKKIHLQMHVAQQDIRLKGEVQLDETGQSTGNKGMDRYYPWRQGAGNEKLETIFGMIEAPTKDARGRSIEGRLICYHVENREAATLIPIINRHIDAERVTLVVSDELKSYNSLKDKYKHKFVNHKKWEYMTPDGTDNNVIEGAWSHLKHSLKRLRSMSAAELQRYVDAHTFLHNFRHLSNEDRFQKLLDAFPSLLDDIHEKIRIQKLNQAA